MDTVHIIASGALSSVCFEDILSRGYNFLICNSQRLSIARTSNVISLNSHDSPLAWMEISHGGGDWLCRILISASEWAVTGR